MRLRACTLSAAQGELRKAQQRCRLLEGELAGSQKQQQRQQQQQPAPGGGASNSEAEAARAAAATLQAEREWLSAQLEEAQQAQQEAAASAAEREAECTRLQQQVQELQQQQQQAAPAAATDSSTQAAEPVAVEAGGDQTATLQQQLAEQAQQLEQLDFEQAELLAKLGESQKHAAAAAAAAKQQQQQQPTAGLAGKQQTAAAGSDSGDSEVSWSLTAGGPCSDPEQVEQLRQRVQQLEGTAAALQADLAAARTGADAAEAAAAADLRRQLAERSQEVSDLSALSIKADATVQQYMAQLRRYFSFGCGWWRPAW